MCYLPDSIFHCCLFIFQLTNRAGNAESKAKLEVKESADKHDKSPTFGSDLKDVEIEEDMEARFKAKIKGVPAPDIHWFINNEEVTSSEKYDITFEEGKAQLVIKSVTITMTGVIKCKVHFAWILSD